MPLISLDHDLSIETCADLKQRLADHLQQPGPLELDGSEASRVHAASLQLLCALFRSREHAGLDTQWVGASPILCEAARLLGLSAVLGLSSSPISIPHPNIEIAA